MAIVNGEFTRNPVAFLKKRALAFGFGNVNPGINRWVIEYDPKGPPAVLRLATKNDKHSFKAYFLPYSDGNSHQLTLGSDADVMFTPALSGCSFVIDNKWYSPMVSHHNRQTPAGDTDQAAVDAAITNLHGAATSTGCCSVTVNYYAVRRDDYVPNGAEAQHHRLYVVGVRGILGWHFYRMKHDAGGNKVVEKPSRIN